MAQRTLTVAVLSEHMSPFHYLQLENETWGRRKRRAHTIGGFLLHYRHLDTPRRNICTNSHRRKRARTHSHPKQPHLHIARHNIHNRQPPPLSKSTYSQIWKPPSVGSANIAMHKTEKRRKTFSASKRKSLLRHTHPLRSGPTAPG